MSISPTSSQSRTYKYQLNSKTFNFSFTAENSQERISRNAGISSLNSGRAISWFKSPAQHSSRSNLRQDFTPTKNKNSIKKHYIPSPYGVIMKGGKLKQRYEFGGIFREALDSRFKKFMIRNENNMRSKYK